jgi:predicted nucleic acid-binding protein
LITPDTVLAEVARKYLRAGVEEWIMHRRLSTIMEASEPAYVDDEIAVEAAKAYAQLRQKAKEEGLKKPSLFNALVLTVARKNGGAVLIGDEHFRNLPETLWMGS